MRSRRLLAAGFAAAIGIAGVTIGSGSLSASSGGGLCEGIDIGALAGSAPAGTESAGTAAAGTEPMATEPAGTEPSGTEPAGSAAAAEGATTVALMFDVTGRGDKSFNDAAAVRTRPGRGRIRRRARCDRITAPIRRRPCRASHRRRRRRQPIGHRHRVLVVRHDHPGVCRLPRHTLPAHRLHRRGRQRGTTSCSRRSRARSLSAPQPRCSPRVDSSASSGVSPTS